MKQQGSTSSSRSIGSKAKALAGPAAAGHGAPPTLPACLLVDIPLLPDNQQLAAALHARTVAAIVKHLPLWPNQAAPDDMHAGFLTSMPFLCDVNKSYGWESGMGPQGTTACSKQYQQQQLTQQQWQQQSVSRPVHSLFDATVIMPK